MALTLTPGSATIGSSEYFLASASTVASYQTGDFELSALVDVSAMAAGDRFRFRRYEKINGSAALVVEECELEGAQPRPLVFEPLIVGEGWELSIQKIAGTDRSFGWSLRKADHASGSGASADDIWDEVLDANAPVNAQTARQIVNIAISALVAEVSDIDEDGNVTFRDTGDTKNRIVGSVAGGARTLTSLDGT